MKTAFLFPGQGSQHAGMLSGFDLQSEVVSTLFQTFEGFLNIPVGVADTEDALHSTVNTQLCLLLSGVIAARLLIEHGVRPDYVAGHSVGTFAAAVISGVITFEQALSLVNRRARLMEATFPAGYGMTALIGYSVERLKPALDSHNSIHPPLYLANINTASQLVIAGRKDSMKILVDNLSLKGLQKARVLQVAVPSHCVLLKDVSMELKDLISGMTLKEPATPYASNATGRLLRTADDIRKDLWINISTTVLWYDAVSLIYEHGARLFLEMTPAGVLAKIIDSSFQDVHTIRLNEARIDQTVFLWNEYQNKNI
jgi:malonate decarboxylase epsilon subunit